MSGDTTSKTRIGVVSGHFRGMCLHDNVVFSPEVAQARRENKQALVCALESTIVSHGMPYPENYRTAREVEDIIRREGAIPATICILGGQVHVGVTDEELKYIAQQGSNVRKVSRRDVPYVMAMGLDGATTVAGTMMIAHRVGIRVFVTGGIGGVHRSFNETMDVSADLVELGRTPVAVICAGAKSILDIPRTLEYLETQGVCVGAYRTDEFPAFYSRGTVKAPCRFDTVEQVAASVAYMSEFGKCTGMVVGCHLEVNDENQYVPDGCIQQALKEAREKGKTGSEETPFVLQRVKELTGGKSLKLNINLVKNNARIGGQICVRLLSLLADG